MAKYYIQSGEVRFVVSAADAEGAAMWVLNQTIHKCLPVELIDCRLLDAGTLHCLIQGADLLDVEMKASEVGFGHDEAGVFDTEWLFVQWHQLVCAMNHLLNQLDDNQS